MSTYRVTLLNPLDWRLTVFVSNDTHEQPYDRAEREVNASAEHSRYGPWRSWQTERAT